MSEAASPRPTEKVAPLSQAEVNEDELLARFLMKKNWVRNDDTIKPDAFMPPKDLHLSVTRILNLSETQLWQIGQEVADEITGERQSVFYGRADVVAKQVIQIGLYAAPYPLPKNANHAHIDGWPTDKDAQKGLALELAAAADKVVRATVAPVRTEPQK